MKIWPNGEFNTEIFFYEVKENRKKTDAAVIIFPGGGYSHLAEHEGKGYAGFLNSIGMNAFVVEYRLSPEHFPAQLQDARRAVRFVRSKACEFGINPEKIAVMGSSAGGHLAAMLSTYSEKTDGENTDCIDKENYLPDAQILCYPVIAEPAKGYAHEGSYKNLLGEKNLDFSHNVDPIENVTENTPQAFIWHTADDNGVNVLNSYAYASALRKYSIPVEMHIFPHGRHGLGLAPDSPHVAQWSGLLENWFKDIGWL